MVDELVNTLALKSELNHQDWLDYSNAYYQTNIAAQVDLIKALSSHTGISPSLIKKSFDELNNYPERRENIFNALNLIQTTTSLRLEEFKSHPLCKEIQTTNLNLTRANWFSILERFKHQQKSHLTRSFFIEAVSIVQKKPIQAVIDALTTKHQSNRANKKRAYKDTSLPDSKRLVPYPHLEDNGVNPLILQVDATRHDLGTEAKVEATGARTAPLTEASPERGYPRTVRTPHGTKARPVCSIGLHHFFKPLTPYNDKGRVPIETQPMEIVQNLLPKLVTTRAETVEYVATLAKMDARAGIIRSRTKATMGASAHDVFKTQGVIIAPKNQRSYHWSHLVAHFLADTQDLTTPANDKNAPIINLIPSTAAANYNVLETIENYISKKLHERQTEAIHITVTPQYKDDQAIIPDMVVYVLQWEENNAKQEEVFYINPQSHQRITKSMHESIAVARETVGGKHPLSDQDEDKGTDNNPFPK